jgi:hypothetical protein
VLKLLWEGKVILHSFMCLVMKGGELRASGDNVVESLQIVKGVHVSMCWSCFFPNLIGLLDKIHASFG